MFSNSIHTNSLILHPTSSTLPTTQSDDILNFPKLELPDPNRFTSSPLNLEYVITSTSTCSKDILNSTQFYLAAEDTEDHLVFIEQVVERSKEENNNVMKRRGRGDILAELPPLPLEEELFSPPVDKTNRKERSIKVLVEALMAMMPKTGNMEIKLDEIAVKLETCIKRVYTICHVMEALQMMIRLGRNVYEWRGWKGMMPTLVLLRQMAENQNMIGQLTKTDDILDKEVKLNIYMMTKKLLMMFLVLPQPKVLSMSVASSIIHGPNLADNEKRCSLQKLGDISNIMQILGLVMKVKVKVGDEKKVFAFQYLGQDVELLPVVDREENHLKQVGGGSVRREEENTEKGRRKRKYVKKGKQEVELLPVVVVDRDENNLDQLMEGSIRRGEENMEKEEGKHEVEPLPVVDKEKDNLGQVVGGTVRREEEKTEKGGKKRRDLKKEKQEGDLLYVANSLGQVVRETVRREEKKAEKGNRKKIYVKKGKQEVERLPVVDRKESNLGRVGEVIIRTEEEKTEKEKSKKKYVRKGKQEANLLPVVNQEENNLGHGVQGTVRREEENTDKGKRRKMQVKQVKITKICSAEKSNSKDDRSGFEYAAMERKFASVSVEFVWEGIEKILNLKRE